MSWEVSKSRLVASSSLTGWRKWHALCVCVCVCCSVEVEVCVCGGPLPIFLHYHFTCWLGCSYTLMLLKLVQTAIAAANGPPRQGERSQSARKRLLHLLVVFLKLTVSNSSKDLRIMSTALRTSSSEITSGGAKRIIVLFRQHQPI